jgi:hypothetical protein
MNDDENELEAHVRRTPPSCVSSFRLTSTQLPKPNDDNFTTTWQLACKCGCDTGRLGGHRLEKLNPNYKGPLLVSPLAFQCAACSQVTELLNTDIHGYHAEVGKLEGGTGSSKLCGSGPRSGHTCPSCQKNVFRMVAGFVYWDFDIIEDEPELPAQEFFNVFLLYCTCANCGQISEPTEFGKL